MTHEPSKGNKRRPEETVKLERFMFWWRVEKMWDDVTGYRGQNRKKGKKKIFLHMSFLRLWAWNIHYAKVPYFRVACPEPGQWYTWSVILYRKCVNIWKICVIQWIFLSLLLHHQMHHVNKYPFKGQDKPFIIFEFSLKKTIFMKPYFFFRHLNSNSVS